MAQVLVRRPDDNLGERLKKRTREHGRSLQSEVKTILEEAVPDYEGTWKRIAKLKQALEQTGRTFGDSTSLIREERDIGAHATWWMRALESSGFSLKFTLKRRADCPC